MNFVRFLCSSYEPVRDSTDEERDRQTGKTRNVVYIGPPQKNKREK